MSYVPKRPVTVAMDARESANAPPEPYDWDRAKTQILASNTAQGVHKHLRTLESNRERVLPRWIWELLQNARDVSDGNASLIASVEWRDDELTFCHTGADSNVRRSRTSSTTDRRNSNSPTQSASSAADS